MHYQQGTMSLSWKRPLLATFAIALCMAPCFPGTGYTEPFEVSLAPAKLEMHVSELIPQSIYIVPTPEARRLPAWDSLWVRLEIPEGFRVPTGSLVLGADTLAASGAIGEIEVALPVLCADSTYCLRYLLGSNRKTAQGRFAVCARIRRGTEWLSARAEATIDVLDSPLFHQSVLMGRVFHDADADGVQQDGEPGIAGARVVSREGPETYTDARGEFVLVAAHGGKHLLELDIAGQAEPGIVLGGRHRLVTLDPGVPQHVTFAVVPLEDGRGEEPVVHDPCQSLSPWDRRLWGGFFVLDRTDDRSRLELVRTCASAVLQPAPASAEPAPPGAHSPPPRPDASNAVAVRSGTISRALSAAVATAEAAVRRFRWGVLRAVEEPAPGEAPVLVTVAAELPRQDPAASPFSGTIEIGEKMFLPGTWRLTGEYVRMFENLGRVLALEHLDVKLRTAAPLRRDEPADHGIDRRRLAAVEAAMTRGRLAARDSVGAVEESDPRERVDGPRSALREARIEEDREELRLVLTFTSRAEYAWGTRPVDGGERGTLCLLRTGMAQDFVMPYLPRKSPLRGLTVDADAQTGSILVYVEPVTGARPYLETFGDPFRLVIRIARPTEPAR